MSLQALIARLAAAGVLPEEPEEAAAFLRELLASGLAPPSPSEDSSASGPEEAEEPGAGILESADLEGLARYIEEKDPKNVICMVGAGLSTAAGIPDFRSPGTGLYDNLQRYNLPRPEAVFDLDFFRDSPDAFYDLARELWPTGKKYGPTRSHHFLKMLHKQCRLLRCYTQNIDMLEQLAGLPEDKIIAAHGNFARAHSLDGKEVPVEELEAAVFEGIKACRALEKKYGSLVKPDIVFFGESLPEAFHKGLERDFPRCDLLIVLGTSLAVQPFNQLIRMTPKGCPRVLINREPAGLAKRCAAARGVKRIRGGFCFGSAQRRDVFLEGDCDAGVQQICTRLGWADLLDQLCPIAQPAAEAAPPQHAQDQDIETRPVQEAATPLRQRKAERGESNDTSAGKLKQALGSVASRSRSRSSRQKQSQVERVHRSRRRETGAGRRSSHVERRRKKPRVRSTRAARGRRGRRKSQRGRGSSRGSSRGSDEKSTSERRRSPRERRRSRRSPRARRCRRRQSPGRRPRSPQVSGRHAFEVRRKRKSGHRDRSPSRVRVATFRSQPEGPRKRRDIEDDGTGV